VVLFGGDNDFQYVGDTWIWDGANWTQVETPGPSPRVDHGMAALNGP
jgi:hypothetical protein